MDAGHVNVILGEAEDKGLRGSINLVGGAKISFDFNGIDCSSIQYIEVFERTK